MKLLKHLTGYMPVSLTIGLVGAGSVYVFTRLLGAEDYGRFGLLLAAMTLIQTLTLTWVEAAAYRFAGSAPSGEARHNHVRTALILLSRSLIIALIVTGIYAWLVRNDLKTLAGVWWIIPAVIAGSFLQIALEMHRADQRVGRYVSSELTHRLGGFVLGAAIAFFLGYGAVSPMIGLAVAALVIAAREAPDMFRAAAKGRHSEARARDWMRYGIPIAFALILDVILSVADRFLIDIFVGKAAVGAYTAGYGLADKTVLMICAWAAMAASPLLMEAYEKGDKDGMNDQARGMIRTMLWVGIPAATGLALVARPLTEAMVDESLQAQAELTVPWIAFAGLLNGILIHYVAESFNLVRRTYLRALLMLVPVTANIALNIILLPNFGLMGAVYATVASYALALIVLGSVGRRLLVLPLPLIDLSKIILAALAMWPVIYLLPDWGSWPELFLKAAAGACVYGLLSLILNVGGAREALKGLRSA